MTWVLIFILAFLLFDSFRDYWKLVQEMNELRGQIVDLELEARADARVLDDFYSYTQSANRRRKRIERALRKEQRRRKGLDYQNRVLRAEIAGLHAEMQKLEDWKRSTSEYLTSKLLKSEDDEKVRQGLTRKVR